MMSQVKLKDLFIKPISGEWGKEPFKNNKENVVGVIRTTNFSNDIRIDKNSEIVKRMIKEEKIKKKKLITGDIIIEKSGGSPTQPVGRVLYYDFESDIHLCNNFTSILRAKKGNDPKYLAYLLYWLYKRGEILKYQNKTTGIINLKLNMYLNSTSVKIPPLQTQNKIVEVLDKAQELIDLRKKQIELLDELIESVFYDMFGDPVVNPKGWDVSSLKEIAEIIMGQSPKGDTYNECSIGTPLLNGPTEFGNRYPIEKQWTTSPKKVSQKGDILFCVRGATAGRLNISDKEYCIGRGLSAIRVKRNEYFEFLYLYLKIQYDHFQNIGSGSTFINIKKKQLENFKIILPPIEIQNEYAKKVQKIEEQKELMQESLVEMENNFNSLMQKAFKGELFN